MARRFAWEHHREGWSRVEDLVEKHLVTADGLLFVSAVEDQLFHYGPVREPWVGVIHQVPHHDLPGFPDLERFVKLRAWKESEPYCRGLWTLCDYLRRFLVDRGVRVPVGVVPYPSARDVPAFDWHRFMNRPRRRLLHVGEFLRNYQAFFDLDVPDWQKVMLLPEDWERRSKALHLNDSVELLPTLSNEEYDQVLTDSAVFLDLFDAPANTAVVECLARGTPLCVNRVGGIEEYLGRAYPLYHRGDAAEVLGDLERVRAAHHYLVERRTTFGSDTHFLERLAGSACYVSLPVPPSSGTEFPSFEVTVLIATYARVYNLRAQLEAFSRQEQAPTFEIVLWNNDARNSREIDEIVANAPGHLRIRVIHSSENIYCAMRWAVPAFARSDVLLVCDDDVCPKPSYLRVMVDAHRRLGPEAALCLRGHKFKPHALNLEDPGREWRRGEHSAFFDESAPECDVHFAHADNFVISLDLLRRASLHQMTHPEYVLVDDYWLSYVLSARLGVTLRKLCAPDIFEFTPCADDPNIALYHNPKVQEQRTRLYVEHMLAGWPIFDESSRSVASTQVTSSREPLR